MEREEYSKKEVFTVPEGYFEQLNRNILDATANCNPAVQRRRSHAFGRVAGYAAAVAILFVLAINVLTPKSTDSENIAVSADNEYIDNILNSYTIDDYTFYCYLTDSNFE